MIDAFTPLERGSTFPALVFIGADYCGHCRDAAPEVAKAARYLARKGIATYAVDGQKRQALVDRLGVDGFPTLVAVRADRRMFEYPASRPREAKNIVAFVTSRVVQT